MVKVLGEYAGMAGPANERGLVLLADRRDAHEFFEDAEIAAFSLNTGELEKRPCLFLPLDQRTSKSL